MGFEIVQPRYSSNGIDRGKATIAQPGRIRFHAADLAAIRVTDGGGEQLTLLADPATGRVAVRRSRPGEPALTSTFGKRGGGSAYVPVRAALSACGRDLGKVLGAYDVLVKDDMLIVMLR